MEWRICFLICRTQLLLLLDLRFSYVYSSVPCYCIRNPAHLFDTSVLETARQVASSPVSSTPVTYDQVKDQCEALVTGKQQKMSVLQSFKKQQDCMGIIISGEQENKSLITSDTVFKSIDGNQDCVNELDAAISELTSNPYFPQGLVYLHHERHVLHRDIKPSNLLVNQKGEIKITDFGVSAMLASSMGQRDTFVGTYNYMSPERISGKTYKSDIWSLGLVILECAIGRFPFIQSEDQQHWPSFYELLDALVTKPPPTAPTDQFPPDFCSFVSACIQKDLKDRSSALDLLSHPFIKKFEDKDIELTILLSGLEAPTKFSK